MVGANSYGAASQVAALSRRFTNSGSYDVTTNPTLAVVEGWIDSVSATLNASLAGAGFTIPVVQADAKAALAAIVVEAVSDLAHAANSAGRYFTDAALARGVTPMRAIRQEMKQWVEDNAAGLEALGAERLATDRRSNTLAAGVIDLDLSEHMDGTSTVDA